MSPIGEKIFITGGAGFLGKNLIKRWYDLNEITIFSRDEAKHYFLKKQYPRIKCVIGDVRNLELLQSTMARSTAQIGIFAASLKQIEACDDNYEEANQIIVQGAFNSKTASKFCGLKAACFISSDKSRAASTIYGSMKHTAGESFISNNGPDTFTNFSTAIYGNILNSTGSIIPLIWDSIKQNRTLQLYDPEMTRFMLSIDEGVDIIEIALDCKDVNVIPDSRSFKVKDLFDLYTKFGLKYEITKPRSNEKIHEIMASSEEVPRLSFYSTAYVMSKEVNQSPIKPEFPNNEYSSKDRVVSKEELDNILDKQFAYFKP